MEPNQAQQIIELLQAVVTELKAIKGAVNGNYQGTQTTLKAIQEVAGNVEQALKR